MRTPQFEHAETLLDVVFGVVIALPLVDLPAKTLGTLQRPSLDAVCTLILIVSSLCFCTFYWLEVRHFVEEQVRFDAALVASDGSGGRIERPLASFLLGGLAMMAVATATLQFSSAATLRPFYIANILFWAFDFIGALALQRLYRPFKDAAERLRASHWEERVWYWGHLQSEYFRVYGLVNGLFFASLLLFDVLTGASQRGRVLASILVLAATVFRHAFCRNTLYARWLAAKHPRPVAA
jgi:hypothetical protein